MKKLYFGGTIITMEQENETVEAVLIEDGIIQEVGNLADVQRFMDDPAIEKIDLHGRTMLPGFVDPHGHISMVGALSVMADVSTCESFQDIIDVLNEYIEEKDLGEADPVVGFGYDHNFLKEEDHPTKDVLNQVSTERPIFISHASGHMGCANDGALKLAGIDETSVAAEGGFIGRVAGTNEPNGYLEEASVASVRDKVTSGVDMDFVKIAMLSQDIYLEHGITTAQDGAASSDILALLKGLAEQNQLKLDIVAYPEIATNPDDVKDNSSYVKHYQNRLKIGGYKLFLDGSPQGKTAWMTRPYEGEENYRGYPSYSDAEVIEYVTKAVNDDVQLLTHCNGDAASDQLLMAYEKALEVSENPNKNHLRPVMIHCQTVRDDQLDQMVDVAMIPSIFNAHTYYWGDVHLKNLGEERGRRISPAKSAFDRGLVVNFHQDAPVVQPDMLHTIWCAVNRITRKGVHIGPEQCVSVYEALQAVTINAAYAYFEEDEKGSIKRGKLADFVVLDENPLEVDALDIKDIAVLETIKEGESVYKKES